MKRFFFLITFTAISLMFISGCSFHPVRGLSKSGRVLSEGIQYYEDGNYKEAAKDLQTALDLGLTFNSDVVEAHKYLAFIRCLEKREKQCRDEFRKALKADPKFDLTPAEAGHPVWGPAFRAVKAEHKK